MSTDGKSIYAIQADFNKWLWKGKGKREVVIYDFSHNVVLPVEGTRKEVLAHYTFFKECYPGLHFGIACKEYYEYMRRQSRHLRTTDKTKRP